MALLEISCLGPVEVRHGGEVVALPTRKTLALLVYLAMEPGIHSREALAGLLWPDSDEERARGALRRAVADIRRALATGDGPSSPHLQTSRGSIGIAASSVVVDIVGLREIAAGAARSRPVDSEVDWRGLLDSYRGEPLDGLALPGAERFEEWLTNWKTAAERGAVALCAGAVSDALAGGRADEARDGAERWIAIDRTDERAHQRLMEALILAGDRAGALQAFDYCRRLLASELGLEPDAQTQALERRARALVPPGRARPRAGELPFAGRTAEYGALVEALEQARRRVPQVVHVAGESGMGKTRLVEEFLNWARSQGAAAWAARAFEGSSGVPLQLLGQTVRAGVDPARARQLPARWRAQLAQLLPELGEGGAPPPAEGAGLGLGEACGQLICAAAERRPLVLFLDDLQWADAASLEVIERALEQVEQHRAAVVTVGAYRPDEVAASDAARRWIAGGDGRPGMRRLALGPLQHQDIRSLLQAAAREEAPGELLDRAASQLLSRSGGQPLFVAELLRATAQRDAGEPAQGIDLGAVERNLAGVVTPERVELLLVRRLGRLSAEARAVIDAAAVLGGSGSLAHAVAVAGVAGPIATDACDECSRAALLEVERGRFGFPHDSIREVAYREIGAARRGDLHARAYAELERAEEAPAVLAEHAESAGLDREAFLQHIRAGEQALALGAAADARSQYEAAMALERAAPRGGVAAARLGLARSLELDGDTAAAAAAYETVLSDPAREAGQAALAAMRLATLVAQSTFDFDRAARLLDEAVLEARRSGSAALRSETEWAAGQSLAYQARGEEARSHGRRSLRIAQTHGLERNAALAENLLVYASAAGDGWTEAAGMAGRARARFGGLGDRVMEVDSGAMECWALANAGRIDAAVAAGVSARRTAMAIGNAWGIANVAAHLAFALAERGDLGEAFAVADEGRRAAEGLPLMMRVPALVTYGCIQRSLFDLEGAADTHRRARALVDTATWSPFMAMTMREEAVDALQLGEPARAGELASTASRKTRQWVFQPSHDAWLHALALERSDAALADEFVGRLRANARSRRNWGAGATAEAALRIARGDQAAARSSLAEAELSARRLGLRLDRLAIAALRAVVEGTSAGLDEVAEELAVSLDGEQRERFVTGARAHPLARLELGALVRP